MGDYTKNSLCTLTILSLFLAALSIIHYWPPSLLTTLANNNNSNRVQKKDELGMALEKASMPNKTLIIAVVNKAYVEPYEDEYPSMFDLFLEGFWSGEGTMPLLDHLLVVAMDETAYQRCKFRRLHCYRLVTDGVDFTGEKLYMSDEFIKMMWRRTVFLSDVLKRGYNFIFTDTDVLWLRNPFSRLSTDEREDVQMSTDSYKGDPWSESNPINTGFYFIRSSNKSISLFDKWYGMRSNYTGLKEQDVLASLIRKGVLRELGLRVRFLDTLYFSGFCSDSRDPRAVATVHANCCRFIKAKVADLKTVLRDWNSFRVSGFMMNNNGSSSLDPHFQWSKHVSCANSWHK